MQFKLNSLKRKLKTYRKTVIILMMRVIAKVNQVNTNM